MTKDYIKSQFVTYEIALRLKEIGFNEPCIAHWRDGIYESGPTLLSEFSLGRNKISYYAKCAEAEVLAPLWQQVIDWFEDKYKLVLNYDDRSPGSRGATWLTPSIIRLTNYGTENSTPINFRNKIFYNALDSRKETVIQAIKTVNENMVK